MQVSGTQPGAEDDLLSRLYKGEKWVCTGSHGGLAVEFLRANAHTVRCRPVRHGSRQWSRAQRNNIWVLRREKFLRDHRPA